MFIVSACLLGANCKYSGGNNANKAVMEFLRHKEFLAVCPEEIGGLSTPRPCAEINNQCVITKDGDDVTAAFIAGAKYVENLCDTHHVEGAILKERSPSCGVHKVYDGTFSNVLVKGSGFTARALIERGIAVLSEEDM